MSDTFSAEERELVDAARAVREHAYAPYSRFRVGAAIRASSGNLYVGCNVENATFGATICAERSAIAQMVAAGDHEIAAVAVFTDAAELAMPCGICRQVIHEHGRGATVVAANPRGFARSSIGELLPNAFSLET